MKELVHLRTNLSVMTVFLSLIFLFLTGCEDYMTDNGGDTGGSNGPGPNEVFIKNMAFYPSTLTISRNTTIKWTNKDAVNHTVTSDTDLFDSGIISNGVTYSHTFTTSGTFKYHCTPHPSMTATVIVN